jgi:hypothetical protein
VTRSKGEKVKLKMFEMRFVETCSGRRDAVYARQVPHDRRLIVL